MRRRKRISSFCFRRDRLGGCTEEQLLRFLVENRLMSQFQFYLALGGLKEAEFVREARHLEGTLLFLTPQGRQSVDMFAGRIRASQQEKLDVNAPVWKRRIRDELQMPAVWQETDNGFSVTLRALESGAEIFSMTLTAATKAQAKRFCSRWSEKGCLFSIRPSWSSWVRPQTITIKIHKD